MLTELGNRVVLALAGLVAVVVMGQSIVRGLGAEDDGIDVRVCQRVVGRDGTYGHECEDAR